MAPIGKLHGFSGNSRFRRALAVATYAGLEVETDPAFTMKDGAWKTKDFLKKFPLGYLPAFEGADGLNLQESGAIADYCECRVVLCSEEGRWEKVRAGVAEVMGDGALPLRSSPCTPFPLLSSPSPPPSPHFQPPPLPQLALEARRRVPCFCRFL
jgi:hypothetical protein